MPGRVFTMPFIGSGNNNNSNNSNNSNNNNFTNWSRQSSSTHEGSPSFKMHFSGRLGGVCGNASAAMFQKKHYQRRHHYHHQNQAITIAGRDSPQTPLALLTMTIESPPLVSYGPAHNSTGALLSGLLHVHIPQSHPQLQIAELTMTLVAETTTRRPITHNCRDCTTKTDQVHRWDILLYPVTLSHTAAPVHSYPFSYLIPGHLPATNRNALSSIRYMLHARALCADGAELKLYREITLSRSILPSRERDVIRIFPPTNLSCHLNVPSVVHPGGDFPLFLRLDGIVSPERETRWNLRGIYWRIDEIAQVISPACPNHCCKLAGESAKDKGLRHKDTRIVGSGEVKSGWKSELEAKGGRIEVEFLADIPAHLNASCDVESDTSGIKVRHMLVLDLIVAEEQRPSSPDKIAITTGNAQVLRIQYALQVTSRAGLGISWDEEQPPIYENVPPSPPKYGPPPNYDGV